MPEPTWPIDRQLRHRTRKDQHSMDEITEEARIILKLIPNLSGLRGVEVGCLRGKTASIVLAHRPGLTLALFDPFRTEGIVEDDPAEVKAACLLNILPFKHRCILHELASPECAEIVEDGSQDFVYIDALHDFQSVSDDIEAWWPKVAPGGLLMGHDYGREGETLGVIWNVAGPVNDFLYHEGIPLHHLEATTWAIKKP